MTHFAKLSILHPVVLTCLIILLMVADGCATKRDHYYTLAAPVGMADAAFLRDASSPMFIEFDPIGVPGRLARPQMVVRRDAPDAEVEVLEQHRWSSSFEIELRDALAGGVAARLGAIDVGKGIRPDQSPTWRISVQVHFFDAVKGARLNAGFSWTLRRSDDERSVTCRWSTTEAADGGIDVLAQSAQRVATRASEAIVRQIKALGKDPKSTCLGLSA